MAQALLNLPDDNWGFTEVWGKATWDIDKANISVFPSLQRIYLLNTYTVREKFPYLTFKICYYLSTHSHHLRKIFIFSTCQSCESAQPKTTQHLKLLWLQRKCRAFKMSWEDYQCNDQRKPHEWRFSILVFIHFFISWVVTQPPFLPCERATTFNIFIPIKVLQTKQYHYHYFTDEEPRYREVKWFIGWHRESLCIGRR